MFWNEKIPSFTATDSAGKATEVVCIAGEWAETRSLAPPPHSWASEPDSELGICTLKMAAGAQWTLPPARHAGTRRQLYFFAGTALTVGGRAVPAQSAIEVQADQACVLVNGDQESEILVLQGRPIAEPVAQYGPFVMNTAAEVQQAFADYRRTEFGGWPWGPSDPTHPREQGRFARRADGQIETP